MHSLYVAGSETVSSLSGVVAVAGPSDSSSQDKGKTKGGRGVATNKRIENAEKGKGKAVEFPPCPSRSLYGRRRFNWWSGC